MQNNLSYHNVKRLFLREVLEQHDQVLRPYASNYTNEERMRFDEVTQGGALIDANTLSGISNAILRPSARAVAKVNIDSGWHHRRFYFMMEIDIRRSPNSVNTEIVSGYTDYVGASVHTGSIDPNLKFYINNHFVMSQVLAVVGGGNSWIPMASQNNQVIVPSVLDGTSTQRPTDLFSGPLVESTVTEIFSRRGGIPKPTVISGERIKLSRRSNLEPASYLSSTLEAQRQSRQTSDFMGGDDDMSILSNAANMTKEPESTLSPMLKSIMQESNFLQSGYFTYGELLAMDSTGTLDDRTHVIFNRAETAWDTYSSENTQGWGGGDNTTLLANKVSMQLTKLVLDNMCMGVEFTATNANPGGQLTVIITSMNLFSDKLDYQAWYNQIQTGITRLLMAESSMLPGSVIAVDGAVSPMGTTRLNVSIDGEAKVPYSFPTFSDSMISSVVNPSAESVMALSKDIRDISTMVDHNFNTNYNRPSAEQMTDILGTGTNVNPNHSQGPSWALQAGGQSQIPTPVGGSPNNPPKIELSF